MEKSNQLEVITAAPVLTVDQLIRRACDHERMHSELGVHTRPARLYAPGESAAVDTAISFLRLQTNPSTTWWDLAETFLNYGSPASAQIALQFTAKAAYTRRVPVVSGLWSRLKELAVNG